jgi:predicted acetyltransferase
VGEVKMNLNEITLEKVTLKSKTKLENLMNLYLHDLSEFASDLKINEDGKFQYEGLELYFTSEDLKPFFITYQDKVVGFILLNTGKYVPRDIDYTVHEFFILRSFRKKGIGTVAINKLFDLYKGKYNVGQLGNNKTAISFWKNFYKIQGIKYTETKEAVDNFECCTQMFYKL